MVTRRVVLAIGLLLAVSTSAHADCLVPAAIPNDGIDDRVAIQAAIDAHGCAFLGAGIYDIGINPAVGMAGITTLGLKDGKSIRGVGPATVLKFAGTAHGDWNGIRMSGANTLVADLLIDDSALVGTTEQTHAIQVQGSSAYMDMVGITTGATIRGVWINHPVRHDSFGVEYLGGDCIRLLGEETAHVTVEITGNHLLACDRSGVAFQRGAYGVTLTGNIFYWTGDSDIDAEMTGTGIGGEWTIANNVMLPGNLRWVSVALAGTLAQHVAFTGNVMMSGGFNAYNLQHAAIANNVIVYSASNAGPVVQMIKSTEDVVFANNVIIRAAAAPAGWLLDFEPHGTGVTKRLSIIGNSLVQQTKYAMLELVSTQDVLVDGNRFHYDSIAGTANGIQLNGVATFVDRALIMGNVFTGPLANAVFMQSGTSRTSVIGNLADPAVVNGMLCFPSAIGIVSVGNNWSHNACVAATTGV